VLQIPIALTTGVLSVIACLRQLTNGLAAIPVVVVMVIRLTHEQV
jgi:hypothetical protein